ncbi:MAG TPA: glucose-1-phosphate thymidylyltransferase RfbA [Alcaligenes sp.]|nr:glucose-1-phosphate thymidylyltransferase RfbA [Alcaligenes sp.]
MKAIILAGGAGSRLYPLTQISSKQLQAVFDKPMIYYPLTVLIASGIKELCLISTPVDLPRFQSLLGDGSQWGVSIDYRIQAKPEGIAQAFLIAADFIGSDDVILMLGDNIFSGGDDFPRAVSGFTGGATIFAYHVKDPQRYGVVEFDSTGRAISIEEKPQHPKSSYAVPGVYIYDNTILDIARTIAPSARGELEITDVNLEYLKRGKLQVRRLSRGFAWLDAGTSTALHEASSYIEAIERRQGIKIGCPEEAALVRGFLCINQFKALIERMPICEYSAYLRAVADEWHRLQGGDSQ